MKILNDKVVCFLILLTALLIGCCIMSGCSQINKKLGLPDDWFGEEIAEQVIDQETGLDLDLTPSSKE